MRRPSTTALQRSILLLSQTTFVAVVTAPVLALLTPLIERAINDPMTAQETLRKTVVLIENLAKLVHNPAEARIFLSRLETGVKSVITRVSLPEVRSMAVETLNAMDEGMQTGKNTAVVATKTTAENVAETIDGEIRKSERGLVEGDDGIFKLARSYICEMVAEDVNNRYFDRITASVAPYLGPFMQEPGAESTIAAASRPRRWGWG
jgi:elongation factor 3